MGHLYWCPVAAFWFPPEAKHPTKGLPLESGTHEEFLKTYALWKEYGWPRILFYRCIRQERVDHIDPEQFKMVADFFTEFEALEPIRAFTGHIRVSRNLIILLMTMLGIL